MNDGFHTSEEVEVTVALPLEVRICHMGVEDKVVDKMGLKGHLNHADAIGACPAF